MQKTAIITWNSFYNYGTCLQAYALQQYILSLGYDNYIVDDSTIVYGASLESAKYKFVNKCKLRWTKLWQSLHANYRAFYKYQRVLVPAIHHFKANVLKIDYDIVSILNDVCDYDVYICGSDQIWSPGMLENPKGCFFFASFTKKRKISYAASIGRYEIPQEWKAKVMDLIIPFSAISVREEAGQRALQELSNQKVELVVDPTLLLNKQEWEELLPSQKASTEKYVLGYILTPNTRFYQIAREYAHQHGMRFYLFMLNIEDYGEADQLISGGPFDFLQYVRDAEMVFTDSYHGTIFATIFETPFYTFKRFTDDSPINQNSRIETLLSSMGATNRLIEGMHKHQETADAIDFAEIKGRLNPLIEHSKGFLQDALANNNKKIQ